MSAPRLLRFEPRAPRARRDAAVQRLARRRLQRALQDATGNALRAFHARYKYLLMACDPEQARALGRMAARAHGDATAGAGREYARALEGALAQPPAPGGHENALLHMFGYVSELRAPGDRARFLAELAAYRQGTGALLTPVLRLREWLAEHGVAYLENQGYFESLLRTR